MDLARAPRRRPLTARKKGSGYENDLRRISSPRTKLLAVRCECLHLIKIDCLALRLDESAHASLAASCEELRARTGNPPLVNFMRTIIYTTVQ